MQNTIEILHSSITTITIYTNFSLYSDSSFVSRGEHEGPSKDFKKLDQQGSDLYRLLNDRLHEFVGFEIRKPSLTIKVGGSLRWKDVRDVVLGCLETVYGKQKIRESFLGLFLANFRQYILYPLRPFSNK